MRKVLSVIRVDAVNCAGADWRGLERTGGKPVGIL